MDISVFFRTAAHGVEHAGETVGKDMGKTTKQGFENVKDTGEMTGDLATGNFSGAGAHAKDLGKGIISEGSDAFKGVEDTAKFGLEATPTAMVLDDTKVGQKVMHEASIAGGFVDDGIDRAVKITPLGMLDKAAEEGRMGHGMETVATDGTGLVKSFVGDPVKEALTSTNFVDRVASAGEIGVNFIPGFGEVADAGRVAEGAAGLEEGATVADAAGKGSSIKQMAVDQAGIAGLGTVAAGVAKPAEGDGAAIGGAAGDMTPIDGKADIPADAVPDAYAQFSPGAGSPPQIAAAA